MREQLPKLKLVLGSLVVLSILHVALSNLPIPRGERLVLFKVAGLRFNVVETVNSGSAFGLFAPTLPGLQWSVFAVSLLYFFATLSVFDIRYKLQCLCICALVAAGIAGGLERCIRGYESLYYRLSFGPYSWPDFNIFGVTINLAIAALLILVALRFFNLLPEPKPGSERAAATGGIYDPLQAKRRWLLLLLWFSASLAVLMILLKLPTPDELLEAATPTAQARFEMPAAGRDSIFAPIVEAAATQVRAQHWMLAVAIVVLFALVLIFFQLLPYLLVIRLIPKRPVDVLFLRAFEADRRGWTSARKLRRLLQPNLRLSGVVDPRASRSIWYLVYWLTMPFVFGIGDQGRVNVLRHNMFLDGDWKVGIRSAFSAVQAAVFDCRSMTQNLAWEIETGLELLGPAGSFFLVPEPLSHQELLTGLQGCGLKQDVLRKISAIQLFPLSKLSQLAKSITEVCEPEVV